MVRRDKLVVQLRYRSGSERMGAEAAPLVLEIGWPGTRHGREKGGMIAINFQNEAQLPEVLAAAAELWAKERKRCADNTGNDGKFVMPVGLH